MAVKKRTRVKSSHSRRATARDFSQKKKMQQRRASRRRAMMIAAAVTLLASGVQVSYWQRSGALAELAAMPGLLWHGALSGLGFDLAQVSITGRHYTAKETLEKAIDIQQGGSIFAVDLQKLQQNIEAIPEVQHAEIRRALPGNIYIRLIERQPAVIWQKAGKQVLMDELGVRLDAKKYMKQKDWLVVVGADAPKKIPALLKLLRSEPAVMGDVRAAMRVGGRRWNIMLKREITVMLPEENALKAWQRFVHMVKHQALLTQDIRAVDMRLSDRVFVTPNKTNKHVIMSSTAKRT
jgi:cell division protein FtsQ